MNIHDIELPEVSEQRIDEIEASLFARIAQERTDAATAAARDRARSARRGRIWMGAAGAAAVIAVAAIIGPQLLPRASSAGSAVSVEQSDGGGAEDLSRPDTAAGSAGGAATEGDAGAAETGRDIIAMASATVQVDDAPAAARRIGTDAAAAGGYVESMSIGGSGGVSDEGGAALSEPSPAEGAWIVVRIPADELTGALTDLSQVGDVLSTQVDRQDVTAETVDLRARVAALEASVSRLTTLMSDATSTADLLAAESALAQRQSELDSLQQQLKALDDQVDFSSLTVTLVEPATAVTADPAGFGDGLTTGWNGLVATLNGIVVGLGFLLPWLAVAAVAVLIVWGVRRGVRARRRPHDDGEIDR